MRTLVLILALLVSVGARAADSLALAQELYRHGTPHLALARVVRDQPSSPDAPHWLEWESLRLTLLSQLGRPAELLERVKHLPGKLPAEFQQKVYGHAAWACLEQGDGAAARGYLARLLWRFSLSTADQQQARRLVIRSYLVEHKPEDAYRAMLRYQQDYAPLPAEVAAEFARGLIAEGRATDAMTWLADLDPASATALSLKLHVGLVSPAAAIAGARAAQNGQPASAAYARVIADAAEMLKDARLRVEARELILDSEATAGDTAAQLWQAYGAQAQAAGNSAQLLQGDDDSWLAMAEGLATTDAVQARAVFAYLAERGTSAATRERALSRLFASLANAHLDTAAARLFAAAPWGGEKRSLAVVGRAVQQATAGEAPGATREVLLAAARYAETLQRFDIAADYAVQAVLASDMQEPDLLATQALRAAMDNLARAGFPDDASALYSRVVALREPAAPKPAAKAQQAKTAAPARKPTARHRK
jgi:hypothetical protein